MENKTIEQIQNEVLELTNKIELVKQNLSELQKQESQKNQIDFGTFMEWAEIYFTEKTNLYEIKSDLENNLSAEDYCDISLSLRYGNEIEIDTDWKEAEDIVKCVMDSVKNDFFEWMKSELENHTTEEEKGA